MRPITKIFLLLVVAFGVYLLWPRTADIKGFQPSEIAKLEVENWVAEKNGKGLDGLMARYKIYNGQYHFSPIAAFRVAQSQGSANDTIKKLATLDDATAENHALSTLTEKYAIIKRQTGLEFDSDALAREELAWRSLERDGAPLDQVAGSMERILAAIYGGVPEDYYDVAGDLAGGRSLVLGGEASGEIADPVQSAREAAGNAYSLLKELIAQGSAQE